MLVSEAYSLITWNIGTPDDSSNRAINAQESNRIILLKLQEQLNSYANITKGITDVFSFPQNQNKLLLKHQLLRYVLKVISLVTL